MKKRQNNYWNTIIRPKHGWFDFNIRELIQYRDLVVLLVKRNFTLIYKQTILGPLWVLLQPLLTSTIFTVVFGAIAGLPTDGVPSFLFYLCGCIAWTYFANCLTATSTTFRDNRALFVKVYFPRIAVPIATVLYELVTFFVQYAFFLVMLIFFAAKPGSAIAVHWELIAMTPVLLFQMGLLGLGFGILVSALTTRYRDLGLLVRFGVNLWMYATPVAYSSTLVTERFPNLEWLYMLNPMTPVIQIFRSAYLGTEMIPLHYWAISMALTIFVFLLGVLLFTRVEKTFMDTI